MLIEFLKTYIIFTIFMAPFVFIINMVFYYEKEDDTNNLGRFLFTLNNFKDDLWDTSKQFLGLSFFVALVYLFLKAF